MTINFKTTDEEFELIEKIAQRAVDEGLYEPEEHEDVLMDITVAHNNAKKLDLQRLLEADSFNFLHDVSGIARYLNRETGQLTNYFVPRFAA